MGDPPPKYMITAGLVIGSTIGGYIPALWHADILSAWSLILGSIGAIAGIWAVYKIYNNYL